MAGGDKHPPNGRRRPEIGLIDEDNLSDERAMLRDSSDGTEHNSITGQFAKSPIERPRPLTKGPPAPRRSHASKSDGSDDIDDHDDDDDDDDGNESGHNSDHEESEDILGTLPVFSSNAPSTRHFDVDDNDDDGMYDEWNNASEEEDERGSVGSTEDILSTLPRFSSNAPTSRYRNTDDDNDDQSDAESGAGMEVDENLISPSEQKARKRKASMASEQPRHTTPKRKKRDHQDALGVTASAENKDNGTATETRKKTSKKHHSSTVKKKSKNDSQDTALKQQKEQTQKSKKLGSPSTSRERKSTKQRSRHAQTKSSEVVSESETEGIQRSAIHDEQRSLQSSDRKQQRAKPVFTQTPLDFKPANKSHEGSASTPRLKGYTSSQHTSASFATNKSNGGHSQLPTRLSQEERDRISSVVNQFQVDHAMSAFEVNQLVQSHRVAGKRHKTQALSESDELWSGIFATCPGRPRRKIIEYCRKEFHNFKARGGEWTAEEDERLAQLVETGGPQWAKHATVLNRHRHDLRDRYRDYIICGDQRELNAWSREETEALVDTVNRASKAIVKSQKENPGESHYQKPWEELIDWRKISEQMGYTRNRLQCMHKWRKIRG